MRRHTLWVRFLELAAPGCPRLSHPSPGQTTPSPLLAVPGPHSVPCSGFPCRPPRSLELCLSSPRRLLLACWSPLRIEVNARFRYGSEPSQLRIQSVLTHIKRTIQGKLWMLFLLALLESKLSHAFRRFATDMLGRTRPPSLADGLSFWKADQGSASLLGSFTASPFRSRVSGRGNVLSTAFTHSACKNTQEAAVLGACSEASAMPSLAWASRPSVATLALAGL